MENPKRTDRKVKVKSTGKEVFRDRLRGKGSGAVHEMYPKNPRRRGVGVLWEVVPRLETPPLGT